MDCPIVLKIWDAGAVWVTGRCGIVKMHFRATPWWRLAPKLEMVKNCNNSAADCPTAPRFGTIYVALCVRSSSLKPRTTGTTGSLKLQCIATDIFSTVCFVVNYSNMVHCGAMYWSVCGDILHQTVSFHAAIFCRSVLTRRRPRVIDSSGIT